MQRLWTLVPGHLSSHSALSSYGLLRRSFFGNYLSLYDLWSRDPGDSPASGASWSSAMPPFVGRGRVINNNKCIVEIDLNVFDIN